LSAFFEHALWLRANSWPSDLDLVYSQRLFGKNGTKYLEHFLELLQAMGFVDNTGRKTEHLVNFLQETNQEVMNLLEGRRRKFEPQLTSGGPLKDVETATPKVKDFDKPTETGDISKDFDTDLNNSASPLDDDFDLSDDFDI